jgi:hypothetical protein
MGKIIPGAADEKLAENWGKKKKEWLAPTLRQLNVCCASSAGRRKTLDGKFRRQTAGIK